MNDPDEIKPTSPEILSALSNPSRWSIFELLSNGDAATATSLAPSLGLSPSATSYHMREMERAGLVEQNEQLGDGRERYWRLRRQALQALSIDSRVDSPLVITRTMSSAHDDIDAIGHAAQEQSDHSNNSGAPSFLDAQVVEIDSRDARAMMVSIRHLLASLCAVSTGDNQQKTDTTTRYRITLIMRPFLDDPATNAADPRSDH